MQFQESWTKERETLLAELEEEAHQLCVREQRVVERNDQLRHQEDLLQARVVQLQEQNQELSRLRGSLESWQARVLLQAASWKGNGKRSSQCPRP